VSSEFNYVRVGRVEFKKTLDGDWGWWVDGTWYDDEPTLEDAKRAASFAMLAAETYRNTIA
jgi:hypothetical protein